MIIFRYLSKEILINLLLTTCVLLVIVVTNQSVQFLQRAASGTLGPTHVLQVIALQIPLLLGYLLPIALYLSVLITMSRLYMDSEMTVLFACGVSRVRFIRYVGVLSIGVAAVVAGLMAVVVPKAQGDVNQILNKAILSASISEVIPGRFMVFGNKKKSAITFYAEKKINQTLLKNVFVSKAGNEIIIAKQAYEKTNAHNDRYLIFENGSRYVGTPGTSAYRVLHFNEYGMQIHLHRESPNNVVQYYSFSKLWSLYFSDKNAAAEMQWRLAMPIATFIFALMAIPLSEIKPRFGKYTQFIPAILIYMIYADFIFLSRAWMQNGKLSPEMGMWWLHGCAFILFLILLVRRR